MALRLKWQWRKRRGRRGARALTVFQVAAVIAFMGVLITYLPRTNEAAALAKGDGRLFYGEGNLNTPMYRDWTNITSTFGSQVAMADSGNSIHHIQAAAAPTRNEQILAYSKQSLISNQLQAYVWNGSTWTLGWQATIGYNSSAIRFDSVYAQSNGQGYIFYSKNNNTFAWRMWNGTTWSAETVYTPTRTTATISFIKVLARPGTNEIAVIWGDDNMDMSGNYFNAATATWSGEPAAALSTNISRNGSGTTVNTDFADLAFENVSGDLLVCWGDEDVYDLKCSTRTAGTGGTWGAVQTYTSFATNPTDMKLASEPGTDYIAYNNAQDDDVSSRATEVGIWDGSTWGNINNYDTSINSVDSSSANVSLGWVQSGGQSRVVGTYDDSLTSGIDWIVFNKNTSSWALQTPIAPPVSPSSVNDYMHLMRQNPYNNAELMFFLREWGNDLFGEKITFDGTNITWASVNPSGTTLETDMQSDGLSRAWGADFIYSQYVTSYDQARFRVFNNADSTDVGSPLAALNTAATLALPGDQFRARVGVDVSGAPLTASMEDYKLQYVGKGTGSCSAPNGTPSSYTDVTSSTLIKFYNNPTPSDGATMTANANDPSVDVRQSYEEANNFTAISPAAIGNKTLWDFALQADSTAPVSTTYCLRIVRADGLAFETYTKYPEVTTSSISNTAPNAPTSLTQKKSDTSTLSTGGWVNDGAVTFGATMSDPDSSDTLQLCVEKKAIGVAFTNTEDSCGSGVAYSGSGVLGSLAVTGISENEYHWQARVKDAGGLYSSWVSYGGNAESARDYGVDTTAPTGGTVYDGTSAGVDASFGTSSVTALSANWSGFSTTISGLASYDYSIGTTAGGTDIKAWTSNGTSTSVTSTGLSLKTSQLYYVNVRAIDNAGNVQSAVSSNGQMVLPSLSFGLSTNTINFSNLNAGNSYTDTQSTSFTTSTNAYGGYSVRAYAKSNLTSGSFSILGFSGGSYSLPDSWQPGDTGFGYTSSDTTIQGANKFQQSPCPGGSTFAAPGCFAPFGLSQPGDIVADHDPVASGVTISNDSYTVTYRVSTLATQAARNYSATIVYSVVPVY